MALEESVRAGNWDGHCAESELTMDVSLGEVVGRSRRVKAWTEVKEGLDMMVCRMFWP